MVAQKAGNVSTSPITGHRKKSANVVVIPFLAISFLSIGGSGRVPTGASLATLESRRAG